MDQWLIVPLLTFTLIVLLTQTHALSHAAPDTADKDTSIEDVEFGTMESNMDALPIEPTEIMKSSTNRDYDEKNQGHNEHEFQGQGQVGHERHHREGHGHAEHAPSHEHPFEGQDKAHQGQDNAPQGQGHTPEGQAENQDQQQDHHSHDGRRRNHNVHTRRRDHHKHGSSQISAPDSHAPAEPEDSIESPQQQQNDGRRGLSSTPVEGVFFPVSDDTKIFDDLLFLDSIESSGHASYDADALSNEFWKHFGGGVKTKADVDREDPNNENDDNDENEQINDSASKLENSIDKEFLPPHVEKVAKSVEKVAKTDDSDLEDRYFPSTTIGMEQQSTTEHSTTTPAMTTSTETEQEESWEIETTSPNLSSLARTSLNALVFSLQDQVKEARITQSTTRSIINILEERVNAQERTLSSLKDQLQDAKTTTDDDRKVMNALKRMVADSAWGVTEIKLQQQQLRDDFAFIKSVQSVHNDTVSGLGNFAGESEETHNGHTNAIRQLQAELLSLRTNAQRERSAMHRAMLALHNDIAVLRTQNQNQNSGGGGGGGDRGTHNNKIHNVPGAVTPVQSGSTEQSGDASKEPSNQKFDSESSTIEESKNTLDNDVEQLRRSEHRTKQELLDVNQKFVQYDGELSKLYALFYNLSLGMATLENKVLTKQQTQQVHEIHDLQKSLMDFTQQMFHLEQTHMSNKAFFNTTSQNEQQIQQFSAILENHASRLRNFEEVVRDYKSMNQQNYLLLMTYIDRLNSSMAKSHQHIHRHQDKASDTIEDLDEQLDRITKATTRNGHRLDAVEIKVLNASLLSCMRRDEDHKQDNKLSDMSRQMDEVSARTHTTSSKLNRLDKGISQLFDVAEKQTGSVNTLMEQLANLWEIIPDVRATQRELNHLLTQVHADCSEVARSEVYHPDGLYVLKPLLSTHTVLAPCQFSNNEDRETEAWTLLQRRTDGKTTFSRTWQEYKDGFGDPKDEFWIGNDNLYFLSQQKNYRLRIELWNQEDVYYYADYDLFRVENEEKLYRLHVGGYSGNATDAMKYSQLMPFSTPDRDNDVSSTHCAKFYTAGWWYKHCHYANLNGRFPVGIVWFNTDKDEWLQMSRTVMKISAQEPPSKQ